MSDTSDKLDEAEFFLMRMKKHPASRRLFRYYLSAFLAAGRSVTFVMQAEFSGAPGFLEWYEKEQAILGSDELMKLVNAKRVMTIHEKPVRPTARVKIRVGNGLLIVDRIRLELARADGSVQIVEPDHVVAPDPTESPGSKATPPEWEWFFEEVEDRNVITLCDEYVARLRPLVDQCDSLFDSDVRQTSERE